MIACETIGDLWQLASVLIVGSDAKIMEVVALKQKILHHMYFSVTGI